MKKYVFVHATTYTLRTLQDVIYKDVISARQTQIPSKSKENRVTPSTVLAQKPTERPQEKQMAAYQNSWAQGWTARGSKEPIKGLIRPPGKPGKPPEQFR